MTPVKLSKNKFGNSLMGIVLYPFRRKRMLTITGVATRKRRNPRFIGDISLTLISTTTNDPPQIKLIKTSSMELDDLMAMFHPMVEKLIS